VTPDELRIALDGEVVSDGERSWRVEVYSISDQQDHRWVQVSLLGEPSWMLTLRVSPEDGIEHIRHTLSTWLADPSVPHDEVINIA
jgi:hypothetical protein